MKITQLAKIVHEANRLLCEAIGDNSQKPWGSAEEWQKKAAVEGIAFSLANPEATGEASHNSWKAAKIADGWVYGEVKDAALKTHPCIIDYSKLPEEQKAKDYLFHGVVTALKGLVEKN